MTPERAAEIHEAFGPCTQVYECMTIQEIVKDAMDLTDREWVEIMLQVEEIDGERSYGWLGDEYPDRHLAAMKSHDEHMKNLRKRLAKFMRGR